MMKCNDAFASKIFWRGLMTINLRLRGCLDQTLPGVSGVWNNKSKIKIPLLQTSALEEHLLLYPELFHRLYRWEVDLPESMGLSLTPSLSSLCSVHLDTALHLRIFFGTRASCSSSGMLRSSLPWEKFHFPSRLKILFPTHLPQDLARVRVTEVHPVDPKSWQDIFCFCWHFVKICDDCEVF